MDEQSQAFVNGELIGTVDGVQIDLGAEPADNPHIVALGDNGNKEIVKEKADPRDNPDYYKRAYFGPHPKLSAAYCDHKIDMTRKPRTNCAGCWDSFFVNSKEFTAALVRVLIHGTPEQVALIPQTHGDKLFKNLKRFTARIQEIRQITEQEHNDVALKADYEFKTYAEVEAEAQATGQEVSVASN